MLTENDVVEHVCAYLHRQGFLVEERRTTLETGVDIVATNGSVKLLVEAKGETSSKVHTNRFGSAFNSEQVLDHVAKATYTVLKLREREQCFVALALPANSAHRDRINPISRTLSDLQIKVFWVHADGSVTAQ